MNTRNFKCFQTVYEERNLQVAASKLFMSPQGLSKLIKGLEEECGTTLFSRTKDGFIPTESGKVFYEKSKIITKDLNEMFSAIEAVSDREKRFKIGFAAGTTRVIDIPAVNNFMKSNPEIVASWDEQENGIVLNRVLNDEINCGLVVGKPEATGLVAKLIKSVEIVLYVYKGHRLWDSDQVNILDIKDEPLVSMNEKYHIYHDVVNACHTNGFNPEIIARVGDGVTMHTLVKNKIGIGICPRFFEDDEDIKSVAINDAYTWDVYGIYMENSPDAPLAKRFLQEM
ncbi:DNA-binding transcriptional regulator, LysR family [Pseudobutyrivibrio sp. UC1225]|uniref:LysR family transcriptional regulator n=1 Tax=Pseudobutyrivibrio sp. UC1225 TaxID=1798185 RepID=UPI0008F001B9|nr:LysR family transcriptional regulator [Pseudobutyrivibrio sp. UC1225]SFN63136.1 DNA-binding transcriptional regulator, LysR family [Pseudobutyrivibrio sp. UC1225]